MKKILVFLFFTPYFLFCQNDNKNEDLKSFVEIRKAVLTLIDEFEDNIKVSSRNEDDFYDLFSENEKIINDIPPSKAYGEFVNSTDWIDIFKGNRIYSVDLEILEISNHENFNIDSGHVNVIVRKNVRSALWNSLIKPNFGIKVDDDTYQNINFSYSSLLKIRIGYRVNYKSVPTKIVSVVPFDELDETFALVPYSIPPIFGDKSLIKEKDPFIEKGLNILGDNASYFFQDKYDMNQFIIKGYRKPSISKETNGFIRDLVYREKLPITLYYSFSVSDNFEFGQSFVPTTYDYSEKLNVNALIPIFNYMNFDIGVKGSINNSQINITNDFFQTNFNTIDNTGTEYNRINTILDYNELIDLEQNLVYASIKYSIPNFNKNIKLDLMVNTLIFSQNLLNSNRTASAQYSAQYGPDLFNILIENNIQGEDFGSYTISENEEIDLVFDAAQIIELGVQANYLLNDLSFNLFLIKNFNSNDWLTQQNNEISTNANELNSVILNTETFSIDKFEIGLGLTYKL